MPLYEQVLASMRKKVRTGEWARGALIPREIDLCSQFGVSRSTVRMAMARMVSEGTLRRVKGVGTYVTAPQTLEDTTLFLNSFAREMESRGLTPCTELLSFCVVGARAEINQRLALNESEKLLCITRLRYAKEAFDKGPLVITTSFFRASFQSFLQDYDLESTPLYEALRENGYERRSFDKSLSARALTPRECRLAGVNAGELALCVSSVAWDQNGRELEYTDSIYPLSKNTFTMRVKAK